jgi:hypothetical protein
MNPERFPTSGAGATAKVTLRLTRAELLELDRFLRGKQTDPLPDHLLERAIGREE